MATLQNSPSLHRTLVLNSFTKLHKQSTFHCCRRSNSFLVRAEQTPASSTCSPSQDRSGRRQVLTAGTIASWLLQKIKRDFCQSRTRQTGTNLFIPLGGRAQEVTVEGQDKVFKDVIEPLETVSVNVFPTVKQDIKEFGSPQQHEIDGKTYYTFEFVAKAPNYTRHALSKISIGNGKFFTLTIGANERRWGKMKDKLHTVVDSFKIFKV
ncbi:PsbP-like protein 1 [Prunus dulcis]|uniref:PsbP-like protein 1 n=1 Tax=Prunus dulcis TaxID=3755 RepID=A0A4Y1R1G6_PRUDU|nr:PsbP-like protein 1 [Prunus dulcis]